MDQSAIGAVALTDWRESIICFRREGAPQLIGAKKLRPTPSKSGGCPRGYAACGEGTYDKDRAVCVPHDDASPPRCPLVDVATTDGEVPLASPISRGCSRLYISCENDAPILTAWS